MKVGWTVVPTTGLWLLLVGCGESQDRLTANDVLARPGVERAQAEISADSIAHHVESLASDEFDGRRPGTAGETRTVEYLESALRSYGLAAGAATGYRQRFVVPAVEVSFSASAGGREWTGGVNVAVAPWGDSLVAFADAPIVFGGYGVVSPEHARDDFAGVSLQGSVVLVLQGAPPGDERLEGVGGYAAKARVLAERGAAAMAVVWLEEDSPFAEARWYYSSPFLRGRSEIGSLPVLEPRTDVVSAVLETIGLTLPEVVTLAAADGFRAIQTPITLSGELRTTDRPVETTNVVAMIPGVDPELGGEAIVLTAHWDHFGSDSLRLGDQIFNGALDNATGTAALLEIARATAVMAESPRRTIFFVWTGAEEFGKWGAKAFLEQWPSSIGNIVANVNLDFQNPWGAASDISVIGEGNTSLENLLEEVALTQGRRVSPEPWPERNYFEHSDQWEFAKVGVPALFPASGLELLEGGRPRGELMDREYFDSRYHQVTDAPDSLHDYSGIEADARAIFLLALLVTDRSAPPTWKTSTSYPELAALR